MNSETVEFSFASYIKDRSWAILLLVLCIAITSVMMACLGLNAAAIVTIEGAFVLAFAIYMIFDHARRKSFWNEACEAMDALGRSSHLSSMLDEPGFLEGAIACSLIDSLSARYNTELYSAREEQEDYRRYIELWIHETKAPIAAASLIAARVPEADEILPELERIERQVMTALFYARATSSRFDYSIRQTDLSAACKEAVKQNARCLIGKGVSVDLRVDESITVQADRQWIVFMLSQALLNSAQYGASMISVRASKSLEGIASQDVILEVEDDGDGIPAYDIESVFERSYVGENGRRNGKSTGMGLYLIALMSARCGIKVSLTSEEGIGTTLSFTFPQDLMRRNLLMTKA